MLRPVNQEDDDRIAWRKSRVFIGDRVGNFFEFFEPKSCKKTKPWNINKCEDYRAYHVLRVYEEQPRLSYFIYDIYRDSFIVFVACNILQ